MNMLRHAVQSSLQQALKGSRAAGSVSTALRMSRTSSVSFSLPNSRTTFARQHRLEAQRQYATSSTAKFKQAAISESEYHELADTCLNALTDSLEVLVEAYDGPDADEFEAEYASGVLNLRLGPHGTYVINKQPPNKQIWFSSPRSGPKRFDYDGEHKSWFMYKDGQESNFRDLLHSELADIFGTNIKIDLGEDDY